MTAPSFAAHSAIPKRRQEDEAVEQAVQKQPGSAGKIRYEEGEDG